MKTKLLFTAVTVAVVFCSCNKILNKSIFTPLSVEDLSEAIKADPAFSDCYEKIQNDITGISDVVKAKYLDITYRDYFDFYKGMYDSASVKAQYDQFEKEWYIKYGKYDAKVDSILKYWTDYKKANSLNRYANIKCTEFSGTYSKYLNDLESASLRFDISSDAGHIKGLNFCYSIISKDGSYNSGRKTVNVYKAFTLSTYTYAILDFLVRNHLRDIKSEDFLKQYDVITEITEIQVNDKKYSLKDLKIPNTVENLLNNDHLKDTYIYQDFIGELIKEQFGVEYEGKAYYCDKLYAEYINSKYPRIAELYNVLYGDED